VTAIVSDTSPINYLILIEAIEVLPKLFDEVLIPPAVHSELQRPRTPPAVFRWAASLPSWARIQRPFQIDPAIALGAGETEAISLAIELKISAILIDERKGRLAAEQRGILPVGTLNILDSADLRGLLDFEEAVARLRKTNFHVEPALVEALILNARARRSP
jgi:predicted nucleic acid-binding protein